MIRPANPFEVMLRMIVGWLTAVVICNGSTAQEIAQEMPTDSALSQVVIGVTEGSIDPALMDDKVALQTSPDQENISHDLVAFHAGELPIILCAPHGGQQAIADTEPRLGIGAKQFNATSDAQTAVLVDRLAIAMERKLGKKPYVVIAHFHRKYVDANRRPADAYESELCRAAYDAYHQSIAIASRDVIHRWGRGILLDIHGQAAQPNAIFRGTQNGRTTAHLINRFGRQSLIGPTSLFGRLAEQGIQVIPAVDSIELEDKRYNGGYTVSNYGSGNGGTLDAIQLELGGNLRSAKMRAATVVELSDAIAVFADEYLLINSAPDPPIPELMRVR